MAVRMRGVVISWNDDRGFGFIQRDAGTPNLFVHRSRINRNSPKVLQPGDCVWFEVVRGNKPGSLQADNVIVDHAWAFGDDEMGDEPLGGINEDKEDELGDEPLGGIDEEDDFDDVDVEYPRG